MPPKVSQETVYQEKIVAECRARGDSSDAICTKLEIDSVRYDYISRRLLRAGKTTPRVPGFRNARAGNDRKTLARLRPRKRRRVAFWKNRESHDFAQFVRWVQLEKTNSWIGKQLGLSAERVRQVKILIRQLYGATVLQVPDCNSARVTISQAAQAFGVRRWRMVKICRAAGIPLTKVGWHTYLLRSDLSAAGRYLENRFRKVCCVCGQPYEVEPGAASRKTCSAECAAMREKSMAEARFSGNVDMSTTSSWRRELLIKLQFHVRPAEDRLVTFGKALELSGLTAMPLIWLRRRKILPVVPHPTLRWHGKPVQAFYASDLALVRAVRERFLRERAEERAETETMI